MGFDRACDSNLAVNGRQKLKQCGISQTLTRTHFMPSWLAVQPPRDTRLAIAFAGIDRSTPVIDRNSRCLPFRLAR